MIRSMIARHEAPISSPLPVADAAEYYKLMNDNSEGFAALASPYSLAKTDLEARTNEKKIYYVPVALGQLAVFRGVEVHVGLFAQPTQTVHNYAEQPRLSATTHSLEIFIDPQPGVNLQTEALTEHNAYSLGGASVRYPGLPEDGHPILATNADFVAATNFDRLLQDINALRS